MVQPAKKEHQYRVVSKTKTNLTTVLYLQGTSFLEAAKKRAKLGLTEPAIDKASVYKSEKKDSLLHESTLIGTVVQNRLVYENIFDKVKEGLEYLTDSFLFDSSSPTKTKKEVVKTIAKRVAMVNTITTNIPATQVEEIYKIKLKIVL